MRRPHLPTVRRPHLPSVRRPHLPKTQRGKRRAVQGVMVACVLALTPMTWIQVTESGRVRTAADVPATDVAVVFGAGLWDGEPSPYLARRLDAAAGLYAARKVKVVLVTGDNSRKEYDEPDAMRAYLVQHGVPAKKVVTDYAGFDTWDSCVRVKKIFGVDRAVLISQGFHIRRALALCEAAGVTSYGIGVDDKHDVTWFASGAREVLAAGKATVDLVFAPDPTYLGHEESGVQQALTGR
jgi:vancomycin permeability regulator SanA